MTSVLTWWRGLPPGARWGLLAAVALAALVVAELWGALVVGIGALVGVVAGRTPAHPGAAEAAGRARTAAELQAESARLLASALRAEVAAAPARDREADRAIAAAAAQAVVAENATTGDPGAGAPAFLAEVERRGGRP